VKSENKLNFREPFNVPEFTGEVGAYRRLAGFGKVNPRFRKLGWRIRSDAGRKALLSVMAMVPGFSQRTGTGC